MSADLYTHGCTQSSSKLFVFSIIRLICKKGFARQQVKLYPQHRAGFVGSAPGKAGVESSSPGLPESCGDPLVSSSIAALGAQICPPNAHARGAASVHGSKLRVTAILKEMLLMVAR